VVERREADSLQPTVDSSVSEWIVERQDAVLADKNGQTLLLRRALGAGLLLHLTAQVFAVRFPK